MKKPLTSIQRRHILVMPFALAGFGQLKAQSAAFTRPITIINPFPPGHHH